MADPAISHLPHSDRVTERDEDAWRQLESVHTGDLPVEAFEQWVYSRADLEALLGPALALDFLTLDYRRPHAHHELRKLVERAYMQRRPKQLEYDMMRRIAREFLSGERGVWRTTAPLARLIATGEYDWIPLDFLYLDSELDAIPSPAVRSMWEPRALAKLLEKNRALLGGYEFAVREAVAVLLERLDALAGRVPESDQ